MAEEVMEVEASTKTETSSNTSENNDNFFNEIINHLLTCEDVYFRSQQREEAEIPKEEKREIASKMFLNSKSCFLSRFGKHLKEEHLEYFQKFKSDEQDGYAVGYYLEDLKRYFTISKRNKDIKNRRYHALKQLVEENNYFTEKEMMKRNPLLYDQLIGQYLSNEEKQKRDNIDTKNITFVNLLLESIDRDQTRRKQKQQQDDEDDVMEKDESEDSEASNEKQNTEDQNSESWDEEIPKTEKWGEFESDNSTKISFPTFNTNFFEAQEPPKEIVIITATERKLLKEEFISIMYQNFLDGKDTDFDYSSVDDNDEYDNLDLKTHDAEDSYFDSETPEDIPPEDMRMKTETDTSEDELDAFMNRLNNHPTVQQLLDDMNKL